MLKNLDVVPSLGWASESSWPAQPCGGILFPPCIHPSKSLPTLCCQISSLRNISHSLGQLRQHTRIAQIRQTRHGTLALVHLQKCMKWTTQLQLGSVGDSHDHLGAEQTMSCMECGEGVAIGKDGVAHGWERCFCFGLMRGGRTNVITRTLNLSPTIIQRRSGEEVKGYR